MNGQQGGDPAKLAAALVTLSDSEELPLRFVAGGDAMAAVEANLKTIRGQIDAQRLLSASLAFAAADMSNRSDRDLSLASLPTNQDCNGRL